MKQPLLFALAGLLIATSLLFPACEEADPLPKPETRRIQLSVFNGIYAEKVNIYLEALGNSTLLATGLAQGSAWPEAGYATPLIRIPADTNSQPTRLVIRGYFSDSVLFSSSLADLYSDTRNSFFVVQENDSTLTKGRVTDNFTGAASQFFNLQFANLSLKDEASLVLRSADTSIRIGGYLYNSFSAFTAYPVGTYTLTAIDVKTKDTLASIARFVPEQRRTYTFFLVRDGDTSAAAKLIPLIRE